MIENNDYNQESQLVLSYEILTLLEWLIEHENHALQLLVKKALANGLRKKVHPPRSASNRSVSAKAMQAIVIDFFANLDHTLSLSLQEDLLDRAAKNDLLRSLEHIDTQHCDSITLAQSVEQATRTIERHPEQNAKELFCKEFLHRWNPNNSETSN